MDIREQKGSSAPTSWTCTRLLGLQFYDTYHARGRPPDFVWLPIVPLSTNICVFELSVYSYEECRHRRLSRPWIVAVSITDTARAKGVVFCGIWPIFCAFFTFEERQIFVLVLVVSHCPANELCTRLYLHAESIQVKASSRPMVQKRRIERETALSWLYLEANTKRRTLEQLHMQCP